MTAAELVRALERDGWYRHHQVGSHLILKHPRKPGRVSVPVHARKTIKLGTLKGILDDAGLSVDELRALL
ncbi:MAG: type II toxin-antitoxin system HicA family toxin [Chloroflexi bacterium]|nr:type II toxin-antitoxin system HicA family toxin [Chloroflexota bacterium]